MERRTFIGVVSGAGLTADIQPGDIRLTAIAAEHLPQSIVLHGYPAPPPGTIFEVRRYSGIAPSPELLERHGIEMIDTTLLLLFPNLAARDSAWSSLSSDPEWKGGQVIEISLYSAT